MKLKSILLCVSAMMLAGSSFGQSIVNTNGHKYTLMEEGTGAWCQWCPDGAQIIEESILPHGASANYPHAIVASFHNNYSATSGIDSLTITAPFNDPFNWGTPYITGFPMGTVDRAVYGSGVGLSRSSWPAAVAVRDALTPKFDVSMVCLYDSSTRIITIKVKAKALSAGTGPYRINAYITEDSISSAPIGYKQSAAGGLTAAGSMTALGTTPSWFVGQTSPMQSPTIYCHMAAVRKILAKTASSSTTGGIWGDTVVKFNGTFAAGDSSEKTFYDTIPTTLHGHPCFKYYTNVIGLVQKYGTPSTGAGMEIDNCIEAKVRLMWKVLPSTGVTDVNAMQDVRVYPNPAKDYVIVRGILENLSPTKVTIYNALGQTVFSEEYEAGGSIFGKIISTSDFSNGVYFMNVANNGESVTKQFTVAK